VVNLKFFYLILIIFFGCSTNQIDLSVDDIQDRFDKGMNLIDKKKYFRAQQHFQYVLLRGKHTEIGDDAQFYLAEAYFFNKEYETAIIEYDKLIRQMTFSPNVNTARYRICEAYEKTSPKFYFQQDATSRAIQKYQEYIEDYPNTMHSQDASEKIKILRNKLSLKMYETAILYIKLEEFEATLNYLNDLLDIYFDTLYADNARLLIIETMINMGKIEEAKKFFDENKEKFKKDELFDKAQSTISKINLNKST